MAATVTPPLTRRTSACDGIKFRLGVEWPLRQAPEPRPPGVSLGGESVSGPGCVEPAEARVSVDAGAWRPRASADAMRTFRFGGKRIFRRYRSRQLAKCEKIKIVAFANKGERAAWSMLLK